MNVLLLGSGGREHALAYKIAESPKLNKLYISPGNPGTKQYGENIELDIYDSPKLVEFCKFNNIDLVVIGPEQPLVDGVADVLRENYITVFGPGKQGAMLEGDKNFAKRMMHKGGIPTGEATVYRKERHNDVLKHLAECKYPLVIKATGLAAGKGVTVCFDFQTAVEAIEDCFTNRTFGDSGNEVLMEEYLEGEEASVFVITDGKDYMILPPSQDHKRINDNDEGKNTGGMGAYAPAPIADEKIMQLVENEVIIPLMGVLKDDKIDYRGCIYVGLMITKEGPKVIEFNCRFGDPETQAVLPLLKGDFLELLYSAAIGKLKKDAVIYEDGVAICVIAASGGYPDRYKKGMEITGLNDINENDILVFHAGTKEENGRVVTSGGRVLGVTAVYEKMDITSCKKRVYEAISQINFKGMHYRKDISDKAYNENPFKGRKNQAGDQPIFFPPSKWK